MEIYHLGAGRVLVGSSHNHWGTKQYIYYTYIYMCVYNKMRRNTFSRLQVHIHMLSASFQQLCKRLQIITATPLLPQHCISAALVCSCMQSNLITDGCTGKQQAACTLVQITPSKRSICLPCHKSQTSRSLLSNFTAKKKNRVLV